MAHYRHNTLRDMVEEQLPLIKKRTRRSLPGVYYCLTALCAVIVILVIFSVLFRPCSVQGVSMAPTLQDGDQLLLSNLDYTPTRGDIVAVRRDNGTPLVKRVIAVAGDMVHIDGESGKVYLNGEVLNEPYVKGVTFPMHMTQPIVVPEGELFILGDNRENSHDSRYADISTVAVEDVMGKVVWRFYPLSQFGGM